MRTDDFTDLLRRFGNGQAEAPGEDAPAEEPPPTRPDPVAAALAEILAELRRLPTPIKGRPVWVFTNQSVEALSDVAVDCRRYNAAHVRVYVTGTDPVGVVSLESATEEGAPYLPVPDPNGRQAGITGARSFDVMTGAGWLKARLAEVSGTFGRGQGFTVIVCPYVAAAPALAAQEEVGAPLGQGRQTRTTLTLTLANTDYATAAAPAWANYAVVRADQAFVAAFDEATSATVGVPVAANVDRRFRLRRGAGDAKVHAQSASAGAVVNVAFLP